MAEPAITIGHEAFATEWKLMLHDGWRYRSPKRRLVLCATCRRPRMNYDGPHAERVMPNGVRLNCIGLEVTRG